MTNFPTPKQIMPEWATHIPRRSPKFKMHNGKGQAVNALNYHYRYSDVQLFKLDKEKDEWVVEYEQKKPTHCSRCDAEFTRRNSGYEQHYDWETGEPIRFKPVYTTPQICFDCYEELAEVVAKKRRQAQYEKLKDEFDD